MKKIDPTPYCPILKMTKFPTHNKKLIDWVNKMARMCRPEGVVWIDGSESQKARLEQEAIASGEIIQLNQEKLSGCFLHRTTIDDVRNTRTASLDSIG